MSLARAPAGRGIVAVVVCCSEMREAGTGDEGIGNRFTREGIGSKLMKKKSDDRILGKRRRGRAGRRAGEGSGLCRQEGGKRSFGRVAMSCDVRE